MYAKNERQVNSNLYYEDLATFVESWIFGCPKRPIMDGRGAQTRYDVIRNFTLIIFFSTMRIFHVKLANSEGGGAGGGELHILSCDRAL